MDKSSLEKIRQHNNALAWAAADWVSDRSRTITAQLLKDTDPDGEIPQDMLYRAIWAELNSFEEIDPRMITPLDCSVYRINPYYRYITLPRKTLGDWELTRLSYDSYETFVCDDILTLNDTREIPRLGYFRERFSYPAILQGGREWMAVKPSEIESMRKPLETISGKVVTFGLGLGYFAYMASLKQDVTSVTIVERDSTVIDLFTRYILPQFSRKEKIGIIRSDAFDHMREQMPKDDFDYAFVDLWHDSSDGLGMYLKAKSLESLTPQTHFLYWVEGTLLSALRWRMFDSICSCTDDTGEIIRMLSDKSLAEAALKGF